jgi:hypothetical protein
MTLCATSFFFCDPKLHLYCTSSLIAQSLRLTGGFRRFPDGSVLIEVSNSETGIVEIGGAIAQKKGYPTACVVFQ